MKKLVRLLIVGIVLAAFAELWYIRALRPVNADDQSRIVVQIPKGASLTAISEILEERGAIRSARAFRWHTRSNNLETSLQAGSFPLKPSLSVEEVIAVLTGDIGGETVVTIPEGYTVRDLDALVASKGLAATGAILECAKNCDFSAFSFISSHQNLAERGGKIEGYLYPDTYFVLSETFTAESFLTRLLTTFETRVVDGLKDDLAASDRSLHEIVTMASLVEEETRTDDERPVVAGILWKRFDGNQGLFVDASNRYILDKPRAALTAEDLNQDSPYNLRRYRGLPPGPVANPGLSSIEAALNPESSKYWYYLHGTDGQIRYAETNDDHNRNKALYLR